MRVASTTCLMVGLVTPPCSHITDTISSGKVRVLPNAHFRELTYIADMIERPPHYLREWREFREMTQDDLAAALGTSKSVISDLERGRLRLSDKWLRRLSPVLKTTAGHLLDSDPESLDTDILDIWASIDQRDRATALRVLEQFRRTGTSN
jgi:transcriptional regulator with XRE-family HTH domain